VIILCRVVSFWNRSYSADFPEKRKVVRVNARVDDIAQVGGNDVSNWLNIFTGYEVMTSG